MVAREISRAIVAAATHLYGEAEAESIARLLLEEKWGADATRRALEPLHDYDSSELGGIIEQIKSARPIQYIIGETQFCNIHLSVREGVLIPRPETEELVIWAAELIKPLPHPRLADIGSGSGAIAISLAKLHPTAVVTAVDLSKIAIEICRENSERNGVKIELVEGDALAGVENILTGEFDMLISNPPYIPQSEAATMRPNVVDHEPHIALFVADGDPLIFYRTIARSALALLRKGGYLMYEIHEKFGAETITMLADMGYTQIELRNDGNDKPRMVCATKP